MRAQLRADNSSVTVSPGIYQHYKGGLYRVIGVAHHSESRDQLVLYQSLADNQLWARPLRMFTESVFLNGRYQLRFERVADQAASMSGRLPWW